MVTVEEVKDETSRQRPGQAYQASEDGDNWESDSDMSDETDSDDDDDDIEEISERGLSLRKESAWDRIKALQDMVPPTYRRWISDKVSTTSKVAWQGGQLVGSLAWVVTTTALLVGLPYALASEEDAMLAKQEREFAQQQSGAQQMLGGASQQPGQEQQQQQGQGIRPPGF